MEKIQPRHSFRQASAHDFRAPDPKISTALSHLAQGKLLLARFRCGLADERTNELVRRQCHELQQVIEAVQAIDVTEGLSC